MTTARSRARFSICTAWTRSWCGTGRITSSSVSAKLSVVVVGAVGSRRSVVTMSARFVTRDCTPGQDPAVIRAFFVHPDWTRGGLGRRILETCEKAAQQAGYDRFELTATLMGRALYGACGYREIQPVDITLRDGQILPHVLMEKR